MHDRWSEPSVLLLKWEVTDNQEEDIRMTHVVIELETSVGIHIVLNIDMVTYFSLLF